MQFIRLIKTKSIPTSLSSLKSVENFANKRNVKCITDYKYFQENSHLSLNNMTKYTPNIIEECENYMKSFKSEDKYVFASDAICEDLCQKNIVRSIVYVRDNDVIDEKVMDYNARELSYLDLVNTILYKGNTRDTRNSTTLSIFGPQIEFDLSHSFPLLTTKRMFWKGIIEELLFMLRGETNSKVLSDKGIHIWDANTTREFLDSRQLNYNIGDMGPMYGFIWRHYGAEYVGCDADYSGKGYDQIMDIINLLKVDPMSRRIMATSFNPALVEKSVLAPCHGLLVQFYVESGKLSCKMTQRSADVFLGLPFNIASYAALTHILAKMTNLGVGKLIISLGDAHIYKSHIEQCALQLCRIPYNFPQLNITKEIGSMSPQEYINSLVCDDFELTGYKCHPAIRAQMIA